MTVSHTSVEEPPFKGLQPLHGPAASYNPMHMPDLSNLTHYEPVCTNICTLINATIYQVILYHITLCS